MNLRVDFLQVASCDARIHHMVKVKYNMVVRRTRKNNIQVFKWFAEQKLKGLSKHELPIQRISSKLPNAFRCVDGWNRK